MICTIITPITMKPSWPILPLASAETAVPISRNPPIVNTAKAAVAFTAHLTKKFVGLWALCNEVRDAHHEQRSDRELENRLQPKRVGFHRLIEELGK